MTHRRTRLEIERDEMLVERICHALDVNPAAVERALELLYSSQTADEQRDCATRHENAIGFSAIDARLGTWLVETVIRGSNRVPGDRLRGNALAMGRRIASRYVRTQLFRAAKVKLARAHESANTAAREEEGPRPRPTRYWPREATPASAAASFAQIDDRPVYAVRLLPETGAAQEWVRFHSDTYGFEVVETDGQVARIRPFDPETFEQSAVEDNLDWQRAS